MKIGVVTVAYKLAGATARLLDSLQSRHSVDIHLFLHSTQADVVAVCEGLKGIRPGVHYYPYGVNRGLSRSWNEGILNAYEQGCDVVIVVNDDCIFEPDGLDTLAEEALARRAHYAVSAWGWHEERQQLEDIKFSCFAINPIAIERVGVFDENIFPIYFEDCDYARRAKVLGYEMACTAKAVVKHGGSLTLKSGDMQAQRDHNHTFLSNQAYYLKKWGGLPHEETYSTPFDKAYGVKIEPELRHAPYCEADNRTNPEIEWGALGELALDIGCGEVKQPGHVGVDPYVETDYRAPMWALPFGDNAVGRIYSSHALEHVALGQVVPTLAEWRRVIKPGGKIIIRVPDLEWCVRFWLNTKGNGWDMALLFGHQAHEGEFHKTGFTYELMLGYLSAAGLKLDKFERIQSHKQMTLSFECSK